MSTLELVSIAIIVLYGFGTLFIVAGITGRKETLKRLSNYCAIAGFTLHTIVLHGSLMTLGWEKLPTGYFIQFLSWSLLVIYFFMWWRLRLTFLALTAAPLAFLLFIGSFTLEGVKGTLPPSLVAPFFGLHIGTLFLSFGLLTMAFVSGLLFLRMDRKIKRKERLSTFEKDLPALSTFDKVNHLAVVAGFPLYTIGMASGFVWARLAWGRLISGDPKEIISILVWFIFAWLFHQRLIRGWRGRKAAKAIVWLFAISVFSLVGVNLFMPTHHSFIQNIPQLPQ